METLPPNQNSRENYRLHYPERERPTLQIGDARYSVTELSEGGMRVLADNLTGEVKGKLLLRGGDVIDVVGTFSRQAAREAVLFNLSGVTYNVLMSAQRRLINRYLWV